MRLLIAGVGGVFLGAFAGLVLFLVILFVPSNAPVNVDGGVGPVVIVLFIAAGFMIAGGVVGCLLGLFLAAIVRTSARAAPRPTVSRVCQNCGRFATNDERALSGLCPGCREPLFSCVDHRSSDDGRAEKRIRSNPLSVSDEL